jgi:hypothetical protein
MFFLLPEERGRRGRFVAPALAAGVLTILGILATTSGGEDEGGACATLLMESIS